MKLNKLIIRKNNLSESGCILKFINSQNYKFYNLMILEIIKYAVSKNLSPIGIFENEKFFIKVLEKFGFINDLDFDLLLREKKLNLNIDLLNLSN